MLHGTTVDGVTPIKHSPAFFDADNIVVEQFFTASDDGTRILFRRATP